MLFALFLFTTTAAERPGSHVLGGLGVVRVVSGGCPVSHLATVRDRKQDRSK